MSFGKLTEGLGSVETGINIINSIEQRVETMRRGIKKCLFVQG